MKKRTRKLQLLQKCTFLFLFPYLNLQFLIKTTRYQPQLLFQRTVQEKLRKKCVLKRHILSSQKIEALQTGLSL
uniref:Uncharacterized protein n=1 Tax=Anguilla anguilla TaxID=7936 RepID=A0A0E9S556_ANGAN